MPEQIHQIPLDKIDCLPQVREEFDDPAMQAELAGRLAEGKITRDGVAGSRKVARRQTNGRPQTGSKRATAILGSGRAVTVCTSGDTLDDFIAALEEALARARAGRKKGFTLGTLLRQLCDQADAT